MKDSGYLLDRKEDEARRIELFNNPSFAWREGLTVAAWGRRPAKVE